MIQVNLQGCDATDLKNMQRIFCEGFGQLFEHRPAMADFFKSLDEALELEQNSRQLFGYRTGGSFMIECDPSILSKAELKLLTKRFEDWGAGFINIRLEVGAFLFDIANALADELSKREHA